MSDAYECDRCGNCRSGAPHKTVGIGDGVAYQRTAPAIDQEIFHDHGPGGPYTEAVDLCQPCWNDLKRWWADGDGELDKLGVEYVDDPDGWDSDFEVDGEEVVNDLTDDADDSVHPALKGAVPNERLRDLAEKWREEINDYPESERGSAAFVGVDGCAAELLDLIDDHTRDD